MDDTGDNAASTATTATITGLAYDTTYEVQVRATNGVGDSAWSESSSAKTTAKPPEVPSTPGAPTLTRGDQKIDVSWAAPASNRSGIVDYDVRYRRCTGNDPCASTESWTELDDEDEEATNTATTAEITGLTNGTTYEVQVRATNRVGDSEWSESSSAKAAGAPFQADAPVVERDDGEFDVYWWAPDDNGEAITGYGVQYRACTATDLTCGTSPSWGSWTSRSHTGTATTTTITSLTNDTAYQVQVRANNAVGSGQWSPETVQAPSSTDATVPGAPTGLTFTADFHSLTVSWTPPSDDGGSTIIGYQVHCPFSFGPCVSPKPASPRPWPESSEPTCSPAATYRNLFAGTTAIITEVSAGNPLVSGMAPYVQVRAKNLEGCGSPVGSSHATKYRPPRSLSLTPGAQLLRVSWRAPISTNAANVNGYDVQYRPCNNTNDLTCDSNPSWGSWQSHSHSGTSTNAEIGGLTNGTSYQVRVRSKAVGVQSDWVGPKSEMPGLRAPDAPAAPTLTSGNAQLQVVWSPPPSNGGSTITDYDVQYKKTSDSDWTDWSHSGTATTATITGLTNGTNYQVQVRAANDYDNDNDDEYGDWSSSATELAGKPAKMDAPSLTSGNGSLVVKWTPPANNGSTITGYRWRIKKDGFGQSWKTGSTLSASVRSTTISSLNNKSLVNGANYHVQMQAKFAQGWTEWSDTATEKVGKPGKITSFTLSECRHTTDHLSTVNPPRDVDLYEEIVGISYCKATEGMAVKVGIGASWQKPSHPSEGGFGISEYDVDYRKLGSTTWQDVTITNIKNTHIKKTNSGGSVMVLPTSPTGVTAYEIRVRAKNSAGYGPWTEEKKIVWPPPTAPTNVTLIAGDKDLRLEWTPPSDHGKGRVTAYYAEYRTAAVGNTPAGQWQTFNGLLCVENRHDLDLNNLSLMSTDQMGITNGTKYDVRIQAINHATNTAVNSKSPWSDVVSVTAGSGKPWPPYWHYDVWTTPDFFPGNYPTVTRGNKQLTVAWQAQNNGGSAVTDYDVRYKTTSGGTWTELDDTGDNATSTATTATITGLTNDTSYDVQIRAGNSNGDGEWTPSFPGTPAGVLNQSNILVDKPPAAPAAPTGVKVLSGPIRRLGCGAGSGELTVVGLTLPSDNGGATVDHLQVRYRETGTTGTWTELSSTQIAYSFTPPKRGTSYDVQVRLKNSAGWGAWSSTVAQTSNKPLPATKVNAAPGNNQLYVRAGAGLPNGSTTTGYQLRYRAASGGGWTIDTTIRTESITTITGLTNNTKYEVQARTTSNNGNSEWSSSAFATPAAP